MFIRTARPRSTPHTGRAARGGLAAVCLGSAALLASCSSTPQAVSCVETGDSLVPAAVSVVKGAPAASVVLSGTELPVGIRILPISGAQLEQLTNQLSGRAEGATFSPAGCAQPSAFGGKVDTGALGLVVGQAGTGPISESVVKQKADFGNVSENVTGKCRTVTVTVRTAQGVGATRVTYTPVAVPQTAASRVVAVRQDTVTVSGGRTTAAHMLTAWAAVGPYTVTVTQNGSTGEPDQRLFDQVLVTATAKAAKAS
ncbi:hypothetical protein [Tsukamurella soli]|uniref:Lipoprotein n=1 Tax=Tsukamurella soli TaxID=644556 RepID=A0ABP8JX71_9ACTN